MVSSSFKKSQKTTTISLNSLPKDVLVEISSCVVASSFSEIHNLQLVSKSFQHYCNDRHVLRRVSFHKIPLFPWRHQNRGKFSNFFKRCLKNGNPEALYRKGLIVFFHLDSFKQGHQAGIEYLAKAAERGNQEARYVYGMILICLGGKTKQKGFKILSSLIKPTMSSTIKEIAMLRQNNRDNILWRGGPMMRQLKGSYDVRESCNCDGRTEIFLAKNCVFDVYEEDTNVSTSSSSSFCEICLWHHEVNLFLKE